MKIIYRGAESLIYLEKFDGEDVVVKERIKKRYRIEEIDLKLRRNRTKEEAKLMGEARRAGVPTPRVIHVDTNNFKIIMEYLKGERVKEFLEKCREEEAKRICFEIGRLVGKLHSHGIIHGDLTTSNMIIKEGKIYFIDFGLGFFSKRIEDKGVDLNLLFEALRSTHFKKLKVCWNAVVAGYKKEYKDSEKVLKRVEEIEERARYVRRKGSG